LQNGNWGILAIRKRPPHSEDQYYPAPKINDTSFINKYFEWKCNTSVVLFWKHVF
jgi:hypothetical protein